jgi:L-glyceraldehyde 3-phosphate reductase
VEIMPEELAAGLLAHKVKQSVDDSLLRLRRDHVDIVMLHNPVRAVRDPRIRVWMRLTPADVLDQIVPALQQVRAAGKTRFLGLACESSETAAVRPLLATREFTLINAWYNLANPTGARTMAGFPPAQDYAGLFDAATEFGASVAVIRPLAGGALTDGAVGAGNASRHPLSRGPYRDNPNALAPEIERGRRFAFLSKPGERTLSTAAYRYILSHPAVCSIVGGFSDPVQVEEAARASDAGPLDPADLAAIDRIHAAGF